MRGRAGVPIQNSLAASAFPRPHLGLHVKVPSVAGAPSSRSTGPAVVARMCLFLLPQGAWRGDGPVWEGGRSETLSLGAGEGGELIFSEQGFPELEAT